MLIISLRKRPKVVYLGISTGLWGYLRDICFLMVSVFLNFRTVIHLRGSELKDFYENMPNLLKTISRLLFKKIDYLIVLGEKIKLLMDGLIDQNKVVVIPNGINYKEFDLIEDSYLREKRLSKRILYLSSLRERKGIYEFIEAIGLVFKEHPDAEVTIAGEWRNGNERERAYKLMRAKRIYGKIMFTGNVSGLEKVKLYKNNKIFVFPPIKPEGLPWVILEAMSAGLPVISTDKGAIAEVLQDGKTGFIVEPKPENIALKICFLIDNPKIARDMGREGRKRIEDLFSEEKYLEKIGHVFNLACNPIN
jgi:glycosyltransferase involved in cell wall biosynthesis